MSILDLFIKTALTTQEVDSDGRLIKKIIFKSEKEYYDYITKVGHDNISQPFFADYKNR